MNRCEEAEFSAFVVGSGRRLLRTAMLITGDHGHAEDLLQTALERTARHWASLDGAPEAYARVVLARLATDRGRWLRSRVSEVSGDPPETVQHDPAGDDVVRQSLIAALRRLTPRQRAVLVLCFFDDLTERRRPTRSGVSVGTVKSTTSRPAARLRQLVPELDPYVALEVPR